jgi:hypothetical protein
MMIGFLLLMLLLSSLICLGSYWIAWDSQDARSRPGFRTKLVTDISRVFRRQREAARAVEPQSRVAHRGKSGAAESST